MKPYRLLRVAERKGPTKNVVMRLELVQWLAHEHLSPAYEVFSYRIRPEEDSYERLILTRSKQEANAVFDHELTRSRTWKEVR